MCENKIIEVDNCNNCPFASQEYNEYAVENDIIIQCNLARFENLPDCIVDMKPLVEASEQIKKIPVWCPLENKKISLFIKKK